MSDNFLPELKRAHDKLVQQNLADKAGNAVNLLITILICSHSILVTSG